MEEDLSFSQRIEKFTIYAVNSRGKEKKLYRGTVVGFGRIAIFHPTKCDRLRVVINECRLEPHIKLVEVYKKGAYRF